MRRRARSLFFFGLFTSVLVSGAPSASSGADRTLTPFRIQDQFDRVHTEEERAARAVLVLCADRKGSRYQGLWADRIRASLLEQGRLSSVMLLEVADLRGVPFFIKGSVKRKFPKEESAPVLLDWKGHFAKTYSFEADRLNIALFDPAGGLVYQVGVQGEDERVFAMLSSWIDRLPPD